MKTLTMAQGSREWFAARLGIPTASNFHRLITPSTMKPSSQALGYRYQLIGEYLSGDPADTTDFDFTARGNEYEDKARSWYELRIDDDVDQVGFLLRDDERCGGSPDGLVGSDGVVEIKIPSIGNHVGHLCDGFSATDYRCQMQGLLWVAEREWCDLVSWHPWLPPVCVRWNRDDIFIKTLSGIVEAFCDNLAATKELLRARGIVPRPRPLTIAQAREIYIGVG